MLEEILTYLWLCLSALAAGVVNAVAGGGTLLTFPALFAALAPFGAEAAVFANATSTVALVPGSFAGAWAYRKQMQQTRRWLFLLIGPSLVGGGIGSLLVTRLDPEYFSALVPWLVLGAAVLFLIDPLLRKKARAPQPPSSLWSVLGLMFFQLLVGVYGGYFGAGIGILMLSSLALMDVGDIHEMNALKTVLAGCINGVAVAVFIVDRKVVWQYAVAMASVSVLGGYLGARVALRIERRYVRWLVIGVGFGLAIYFFVEKHLG